MSRPLYMEIKMNNEKEESYITNLLKQLFLSMDISCFDTFVNMEIDSSSPVLGRGVSQRGKGQSSQAFGLDSDHCVLSNTLLKAQSHSITIIGKARIFGRRKKTNPLDVLGKFPWKFHHRTQLLDLSDMKVAAKQDFYEISPKLPLISVMDGFGDVPIVRYGIDVRSFYPMMKFYKCLLNMDPFYKDDAFCCFDIGIHNDVQVQLSIKVSPQLNISETTNAILVSQLANASVTAQEDDYPYYSKTVLELTDPDGNLIEIRQKGFFECTECCDECSSSLHSATLCDDCNSVCDCCSLKDECYISGSESQVSTTDSEKELLLRNAREQKGVERERTDSGFIDRYESDLTAKTRIRYKRTEC